MYCRAPRVLLPCPTGPTAVPYKSYLRQNLKLQFHNIVIYLPTYTHCDTWVHLYNSIWTGAMNRPLRLRNVCCGLFTYTNVYPRAPTVGIRFIVPAYHGIHAVDIYSFSSILLRRKKLCNDGCNIHSA